MLFDIASGVTGIYYKSRPRPQETDGLKIYKSGSKGSILAPLGFFGAVFVFFLLTCFIPWCNNYTWQHYRLVKEL